MPSGVYPRTKKRVNRDHIGNKVSLSVYANARTLKKLVHARIKAGGDFKRLEETALVLCRTLLGEDE